MHALAIDGQLVAGPCDLPASWANISGFHHLPSNQLAEHGWLPVVEDAYDPETHASLDRQVVVEADCVRIIHQLVERPTPYEVETAWESLRIERDRLLAASDWTQMPDAPLSAEAVEAWRQYRQALRDLPAQASNPFAPVWPEKP